MIEQVQELTDFEIKELELEKREADVKKAEDNLKGIEQRIRPPKNYKLEINGPKDSYLNEHELKRILKQIDNLRFLPETNDRIIQINYLIDQVKKSEETRTALLKKELFIDYKKVTSKLKGVKKYSEDSRDEIMAVRKLVKSQGSIKDILFFLKIILKENPRILTDYFKPVIELEDKTNDLRYDAIQLQEKGVDIDVDEFRIFKCPEELKEAIHALTGHTILSYFNANPKLVSKRTKKVLFIDDKKLLEEIKDLKRI